ncbi:MAG: GAF domain-containing protein [Rhodospirillaceae bacterium]|nr:GAF domain-containing protein [Rhodospirillaceae bacterium]
MASDSDTEARRLAALNSYKILDTPNEERFDRIVRMAARVFGSPIALISLVDRDRQWFKAAVGLAATETPRAISFCTHAIQQRDVFIVGDAAADARFADNPLVTSDPQIRFYAGAPLVTPGGHAIGTVCVIDREPWMELPDFAKEALRDYAAAVVDWLESDRKVRELTEENARLKAELAGR